MNSSKRSFTAALASVALAALAASSVSAQMTRGGTPVGFQGGTGGLGAQGSLAINPGGSPFFGGGALMNNPLGTGTNGLGNLGYYYQNGYGGYGTNLDTLGGYVRGGADAIRAQGNFLIQNQQSMILRESARQSRIETRRRNFDEYLYERERTPTPEQERQRDRREQILRSMNDPPATEILSGKALNDLLGAILDAQGKNANTQAATVAINSDLMESVNTTSLRTGTNNTGLLKARGKFVWPEALTDLAPVEETAEQRKQIDSLYPEALQQARNGKVDGNLLKELNGLIARLDDKLTRSVGDVTFGSYSDAKRFLHNLDDAVTVLRQPDAGDYLPGGKNAVRAGSVQDLVKGMAERGLRFAPSVPGDEKAYAALHRGLVSYYNALTQNAPAER